MAVNLLGQNTTQVATLATVAGKYLVTIYHACTLAGSGGLLTTTLAWTDDVGATSAKIASDILLSELSRDAGALVVYLASGTITVTATPIGATGNPQYALRARAVALS